MAVNIQQFAEPTFYNYKYDQLNRIKAVDVWLGFNEDTSKYNTSFAYTQAWKERFKYDGNGNILHADRYSGYNNVPLDSMDYHYTAGTNKLTHITEASESYSWLEGTKDIETQPVNNYGYDAIGNLVRDSSENIGTDSIKWNVYGKIKSISRSAATATNDTRRMEYTYDAAGNRIGQKLTKFASSWVWYTWYVRDAQGNVLNVYTASRDTSSSPTLHDFDLILQESHLYGISRLGIQKRNIYAEPPSPRGSYYDYYRGDKFYEISNHLGNVVTTISDKKFGMLDSSTSLTRYAWYTPEIVMANDYYVFGMERKHYDAGIYFYGYSFNGKMNDRDVKGEGNQIDYGMRVQDTRVGRFFSIDPLTKKYPELSPYQFASNRPIQGIDLDGLEFLENLKTQQARALQQFKQRVGKPLMLFEVPNSAKIERQVGHIEDGLAALLRDNLNDRDNIGGNAMAGIVENAKNANAAFKKGDYVMGTIYALNSGIDAGTLAGSAVAYNPDLKIKVKTEPLPAAPGPRMILYHYTTQEGQDAILNSKTLNPSLKAVNPSDARYGDGQYLSDIAPGTKTPAQLSKAFLNLPYLGRRFTNYVAIDVTGLKVEKGRDGVFVIPNAEALDLTSRIVGSGKVQAQAPASTNNH